MVSHRGYNSGFCCFLQFLALNESKVEIVTLGLLPDVVGSVISSPQNKINVVSLFDFLNEKHEGLERKVAVTQTAPIISRTWIVVIDFEVLFVEDFVDNFFVR